MSKVGVSPPDSLMRYETPLVVGSDLSNSHEKDFPEGLSKQDDMLNSMLPPR